MVLHVTAEQRFPRAPQHAGDSDLRSQRGSRRFESAHLHNDVFTEVLTSASHMGVSSPGSGGLRAASRRGAGRCQLLPTLRAEGRSGRRMRARQCERGDGYPSPPAHRNPGRPLTHFETVEDAQVPHHDGTGDHEGDGRQSHEPDPAALDRDASRVLQRGVRSLGSRTPAVALSPVRPGIGMALGGLVRDGGRNGHRLLGTAHRQVLGRGGDLWPVVSK